MKTNINIKICAAVLLMMGLLPMLSSCDNEAVENSGNQRKIVFSSVLGEVSTRGTIATDLGGSIALMAYRYSGEWTGNTESPNFMYKEAATSLDNTNWTTATQYYWPNTSERMRFFGYAPVDAYDGTNGTLSAQSALGPVTFSGFTVPTNIADQQIAGADVTAQLHHHNGLGAKVSYAFTKNIVKKGQPDLTSARPHSLTWRFDYDHQFTKNYGLYVALSGRFLSAVDVTEYTSQELDEMGTTHYNGHTLWKLSLSQRFMKGINLNCAVDNLFNYQPKKYYANSPVTIGTTVTVGLSIDIDKFF